MHRELKSILFGPKRSTGRRVVNVVDYAYGLFATSLREQCVEEGCSSQDKSKWRQWELYVGCYALVHRRRKGGRIISIPYWILFILLNTANKHNPCKMSGNIERQRNDQKMPYIAGAGLNRQGLCPYPWSHGNSTMRPTDDQLMRNKLLIYTRNQNNTMFKGTTISTWCCTCPSAPMAMGYDKAGPGTTKIYW